MLATMDRYAADSVRLPYEPDLIDETLRAGNSLINFDATLDPALCAHLNSLKYSTVDKKSERSHTASLHDLLGKTLQEHLLRDLTKGNKRYHAWPCIRAGHR